jgi:hypothetical protein
MPDSMHDHDAILRSLGRIPAIRALLASQSRTTLAHLSVTERDRVLDDMALRQFRGEQITETHRY